MPSGMLRRLLHRRPRMTVETATVPEGHRVYAIGDIHGRADLLTTLHRDILVDAANAGPGTRKIAIYLGDYLDRGLQSREVIDLLLDQPLPDFASIHLRGNHEHEAMAFLREPARGATWLRYGGDATLYSYGVRLPAETPPEERLEVLSKSLLAAMPTRHRAFLEALPLAWELGDYFFVHAGVDPDKALDRQDAADMMWIREPFLEAECDFGKVVVHGHSVTEVPDVRDNRIGIDTGACFTNTLTSLVLEGGSRRFLSTRPARPA